MIRHPITILVLAFAIVFPRSPDVVAAEDLGFGYVRRGQRIHFDGGGKSVWNSTRIDEPSRENIDGFTRALGRKLSACKSLDAVSFEPLSEEYSRDKDMVYYKWISPGRFLVVELPEADVTSFKPINFAHAIDKNAIWYLDEPIQHSDPATAVLISDRIVKDAKNVYVSGELQSHLDAKTFRHIGSAYYVDSKAVYWGSVPVAESDLPTFRVLDDSFMAVDRNHVYRSGERQPNLDAASCQLILDDPYGYQVISDKNGVYLNNLRFLHANADNFKMIDNLSGRDATHVFLIDTWHSTPVTVYREEDQVVAETILYETGTHNALAIIKAQVGRSELKNITLSAPPGETAAREVPQWQIDIFRRPEMIHRMNKAGKLLK